MLPALQFVPLVAKLADARKSEPYTVYCGPNNCGKSLLLKKLWSIYGGSTCNFISSDRFISHVALTDRHTPGYGTRSQPDDVLKSGSNLDAINKDQSYTIRNMDDSERNKLLETLSEWLGYKFSIDLKTPTNRLSDPILSIDGKPFGTASTGTRILFSLLTMLYDSRFNAVLIDEPEIGLSPSMQDKLASTLMNTNLRNKLFSHIESIHIATHSHIFLDRHNINNNYRVSRENDSISIHNIQSVSEFHNLQFNLLGNSLTSFNLPEAIVIVEGKTDYPFIKRAIETCLPSARIVVAESQGNLKDAVRRLSVMLGGISSTVFASRLFAVFDRVHNRDQREEIEKLGILSSNIVIWERNGIEYLYPKKIMSQIFRGNVSDDMIKFDDDDRITINGIVKTKSQLSNDVCGALSQHSRFEGELDSKLLAPLKHALDGH